MGELLRRQGYAATGINALARAAEALTGSLSHHFRGGKREIAVAALRQTGAVHIELLPLLLDPYEDLAEGIEAALARAGENMRDTGWANMCPVGSVTAEVADAEPELRAVSAEVMRDWLDKGTAYFAKRGLTAEAARESRTRSSPHWREPSSWPAPCTPWTPSTRRAAPWPRTCGCWRGRRRRRYGAERRGGRGLGAAGGLYGGSGRVRCRVPGPRGIRRPPALTSHASSSGPARLVRPEREPLSADALRRRPAGRGRPTRGLVADARGLAALRRGKWYVVPSQRYAVPSSRGGARARARRGAAWADGRRASDWRTLPSSCSTSGATRAPPSTRSPSARASAAPPSSGTTGPRRT
ncbi:TetR/AcrR family transcriptional regulator [Streptomyces sp. SolWspMP-sol7th]|uniref:TetR/AcrR family transcriptional regulator n=1 Tax=Streptomyces sp. SolWspMP-sol7th TaxID=1839776 RepID=UPI0020C7E12D|nr:TetR/AcrR family transcriptional regulator [Streptomyces sp. SolWspMP-sol7th]